MKLKYNIQFFAAGKVCTGFSKPYVANYAANAGVVRYTNARKLARGVSVSMTPDSGGDNDFYTDNQLSESESGAFTSGSVTLTIDGLFIAAERQIMGLPEADASGWTGYGDGQSAPNMGLGFVVRYMSDGVTTYTPVILSKVKFNQVPIAANTAGQTIDWQTEELSAKVMRSDDNNHTWKFIGAEYATEEEAERALQVKFGIYITGPYVEAVPGGVTLYGALVSSLQDDVVVSGNQILGTLKFIEGGIAESGPLAGDGYFIALQLSNFDNRATSCRVGLNPSEGTGLVEIIDDPDKNLVAKVTNKDTQNFEIVTSDGTHTTTDVYDLSGLVLDAGA